MPISQSKRLWQISGLTNGSHPLKGGIQVTNFYCSTLSLGESQGKPFNRTYIGYLFILSMVTMEWPNFKKILLLKKLLGSVISCGSGLCRLIICLPCLIVLLFSLMFLCYNKELQSAWSTFCILVIILNTSLILPCSVRPTPEIMTQGPWSYEMFKNNKFGSFDLPSVDWQLGVKFSSSF